MPLSDHRNQFTKEAIRQRLTRHLMQMWGVSDLNHLDTFVRMLLDTVANEVHRISHDFIGSEVRVLEKLAALLTPDLLTVAQPAHMVIRAHPVEPTLELTPDHSFFVQKRYATQLLGALDGRQDVFFSALEPTRLVDGNVRMLAAGSQLFRFEEPLGKVSFLTAKKGHKLPAQTLFIGLEVQRDVETLDGVNFYVEWPDDEAFRALYPLLSLGQWSLNGHPIETAIGPSFNPAYRPNPDGPTRLLAEHEISYQLEEAIRQTYRNRFIHVVQTGVDDLWAARTAYPPVFADLFDAYSLGALESAKLLWLSVELPAQFTDDVLETLSVSVNAFPVMNRKQNRMTYRTRALYHLLPLRTEPFETLLTVRTVQDSKERVYTPFPFHRADHIEEGSYAVRRGGVERFDLRDAREALHHLVELLREEAAAFQVYGRDTIQLQINQLLDQIEQMERKLHNATVPPVELTQYILFKPFEEGDTMQVDFWTTNCELANQIPAGSRLEVFNTDLIRPDSALLLTTSTGGRNRPTAMHRVSTYRYALLSRQRLVTQEDVISFLHAELGPLLQSVSIRKGVSIGTSAKEGLMRTVDVFLTPPSTDPLTPDEWEITLEGLRQKLIDRSGQVIQYRLFGPHTTV
ncbi:MAG: hypothetical protein EAZ91_20995 [Cytophagales bacterium]|nr:MAG: hypothetical protein EAZ91_20995 [Cytophagales bacterium]